MRKFAHKALSAGFYTAMSLFLILTGCQQKVTVEEQNLKDGWFIRSADEANVDGATLSSTSTNWKDWVQVTVPSTVLGGLVEAGIYKDPFFADNLAKIPRAPFEVPWWYCNTFNVENYNPEQEQLRLFIDGINYRANIWLNGTRIGASDTLFGAFRQFVIDVSAQARTGENYLALEILPPQPRDFYMGFVDWAPTPPDHYMGIYREVRLRRSGKVSIDAPFVAPDVNLDNLQEATLKISTEVTNYSDQSKSVTISGKIESITVEKSIDLDPGQKTTISFIPSEFDQLIIKNPRLWWPNGLGEPALYTLDLELKENGTVIDNQTIRFGIRKVETYLNDSGVRGYKVNGREVLIKSGGWVDDLFLRYMPEKDAAQIRYVKEMNMNSLRFEGVWGNNHHIYDLCDESGILLMVGWSCQWEWPDYLGLEMNVPEEDQNLPINEGVDLYSVKLTPDEETLFSDYFRDQVKWLRNHPSIFVWAVGSDAMPKPSLEKKYLQTMTDLDPTRSLLVSAGEFTSEITGPSGMKMNGPYEYVPPIYWYEDKQLGGAFGFNSETGPGPQIPPVESIKKMIPEDHLWPPINYMWNYHSGRKDFNSVNVYLTALNNRYGTPENLDQLAYKAQLMNYEAIRPMFEAFVVNKPTATGVVQWMLNSPWPEFYWQLYDYYLMPTGAYFGTQKACQPLNLIYNYYDHKVYACNDLGYDIADYQARVRLFDFHSKVVYESSEPVSLMDNVSSPLLVLPPFDDKNAVYFLDLEFMNAQGEKVSNNFYWLAGKPDQLDWEQYFWYYTPQRQFADYTGLNNLDRVAIEASSEIIRKGSEWEIDIQLHNPGNKIAFFMELNLIGQSSQSSVLPVFWNENYVSLVPGESKKVTVNFYGKDLIGQEPAIQINGLNLEKQILIQ